MSQPLPVRVTRYRCPHCARSHSSRGRAVEHMGRCWQNPDTKGCKTCVHFIANCDNYGDDYRDGCKAGVDLTGRPACKSCGGWGSTVAAIGRDGGGVSECSDCGGDAAEVKPGPITGCSEWQPIPAVPAQSSPSEWS